MKKIMFLSVYIITGYAHAQNDSLNQKLQLSGYLDVYYAYDFVNPPNHNRPAFLYSYNQHNEVNLNLGFLKAAITENKVRANLAFATGTYMNANLSTENGVFKNIFEANIGIKLSRKKDIWADAGIFASHIGFESAIGKDCWTLSRSILAENTPYYESGVRVAYTTPNQKWYMALLLLNGWQNISRINGNNTPAFGHQITFKPTSNITLNSSSFIGNILPDSIRAMRYFHNLYGIFQLTQQWGITAGFDIGFQQKSTGSHAFNHWYSYVCIAQWKPSPKNVWAARIEYYADPDNVIIPANFQNGFKTFGYSINYDRAISSKLLWRIEARDFYAAETYFENNNIPVHNNFAMTTSISIVL
ncbi:porin [Hydrotalea sp. AMD]|uniref:porin n=1 Tax=Hydrotalea sp. AMD TaxID=2501297 RepID=UPI000AF60F32|nr:porin [Hydrotalea sp. AMD]